MSTVEETIRELKVKIIATLGLLDITPDDMKDDDPLVGGDTGIDSIDVLELVMMIEKDYGVKIESKELGVKVFASVRALATFIAQLIHGQGRIVPCDAVVALLVVCRAFIEKAHVVFCSGGQHHACRREQQFAILHRNLYTVLFRRGDAGDGDGDQSCLIAIVFNLFGYFLHTDINKGGNASYIDCVACKRINK